MTVHKTLFATGAGLFACVAIRACDLCAIYNASEAQGLTTPGWFAGVAEQHTHFGTLRLDGANVSNPAGQRLDSFITQTVVGYTFNEHVNVQFTAPFIVRSFQRPEGFQNDSGTEAGWGDATLVARYLAFRRDAEKTTILWSVFGGIKFPTGSANRIREEFSETEFPGAPESGVHGHDLALGSGSTDGIVGTNAYMRVGYAFATGSIQYAARRRGSFGYRFADDTSWEAGPGFYLAIAHDHTVALQVVLSGEHKGKDTFQGATADDTASPRPISDRSWRIPEADTSAPR